MASMDDIRRAGRAASAAAARDGVVSAAKGAAESAERVWRAAGRMRAAFCIEDALHEAAIERARLGLAVRDLTADLAALDAALVALGEAESWGE